jgi:hypothetical protein
MVLQRTGGASGGVGGRLGAAGICICMVCSPNVMLPWGVGGWVGAGGEKGKGEKVSGTVFVF